MADMSFDARFDRNIRLFGSEGQLKLRKSHVVIVGAGGLGTQVAQQVSLLGVGTVSIIDDEELEASNRNRYVGVWHSDPTPGSRKIDLAARLISLIDPEIYVQRVFANVVSRAAFDVIKSADHVFGCLDDDGARFVLNDVATAYGKPYIDLASDVVDRTFGGRIIVNWDGSGCLYCLDELDQSAIHEFLESEAERKNRAEVYGVDRSLLGSVGPSVVSINGVIASLSITEYMVACTGMRSPHKFINYDGLATRVSVRKQLPRSSCPYCNQWGLGDRADVDRYWRRVPTTY
jgi:molybdopterin/thiamine biosynthesis adenylyltransferase